MCDQHRANLALLALWLITVGLGVFVIRFCTGI